MDAGSPQCVRVTAVRSTWSTGPSARRSLPVVLVLLWMTACSTARPVLWVRTAISSSSRNCAAILRAARLSSLFEVRVDGVDLERFGLAGKPAPDMFLEAARRLGVPPARAAVFEDATAGVEASRAGSFGLVVGLGAAEHAAALRARGAHAVVADLAEGRLEDRRPGATVAV